MARKKLYPNYSDDVNSKMTSVYDFLKAQNAGKIPPKDLMLMDKLADLLDLYERIKDYNDQNGITMTNSKGMVVKSDMVKAQLETFTQIMKVCEKYGLTLRDERKIKEVDADQDTLMDMIEALNEN